MRADPSLGLDEMTQLKALNVATVTLFAVAFPGVPVGAFLAVTISPWFAAIPAVLGVCGSVLYAWSTRVKKTLKRQLDDKRESAEPNTVDEMAKLRVELAKRTGERDEALARAQAQRYLREQMETSIATFRGAMADMQEQLAEAEATISGLGLENADLRRAIVDADNTAARTVTP